MAAPANRGFVALLKKSWNEIPEVLGSLGVGVLGIGMCIGANIYYYRNDLDNRIHRPEYTVYRHDDPRVQKLRASCDLTSRD